MSPKGTAVFGAAAVESMANDSPKWKSPVPFGSKSAFLQPTITVLASTPAEMSM